MLVLPVETVGAFVAHDAVRDAAVVAAAEQIQSAAVLIWNQTRHNSQSSLLFYSFFLLLVYVENKARMLRPCIASPLANIRT